jgi:hypothetical protein
MANIIPTSFREVINLWPARSALGRRIGDPEGARVRDWYARNVIPEPEWDGVVAAAAACSFVGVTYALLASFKRGT